MQCLNIEKYRTIWLNQLLLEYEQICWSYGVELSPPVFEITDSQNEIGSWHSKTRTIRLSRHLIAEHSWMVTLQVLKHEMVHQLCSEIFGSKEKGHGAEFKKGCELLGVEPEYCQAKSSLPELEKNLLKGKSLSGKGRVLVDKVEKLFALARSPNEHEAALAVRKANELIEKYNLYFYKEGIRRDFGYAVINRRRKRIESYQRHICRILQDFSYVRVVMSSLYDPEANQHHKIIEIIGAKENVAIGEYCYFFLENKLFSLWNHNRHKFRGTTVTEKNSYFLGLLAGFYDKLKRQGEGGRAEPVKAGERESAVVHATAERELEKYVGRRFPRLQKISRRAARVYKNTYNEGVTTGRTITFAEGVTGQSVQSGRFLPAA